MNHAVSRFGPPQLPFDVIDAVVVFIADGPTLARCSHVSRLWRRAASDDGLWKKLYQQKWCEDTAFTKQHQHKGGSLELFRRKYARRFSLDKLASKKMAKLVGMLQGRYGGRPRTILHLPMVQPEWVEMRKEKYIECVELFRTAALGESCPSCPDQANQFEMKLRRFVASILFDYHYHFTNLRKWSHLVKPTVVQGNSSEICMSEAQQLEFGTSLLTVSQLTYDRALMERSGASRQYVSEKLDEIASNLKQRIASRTIDGNVATVCELTKLLESMGFHGNDQDYYDVRNSLLGFALRERKGIPISLAVIYKCILSRIGVPADIIGIPGHVVLGIPSTTTYVDVFNGGEVLSEQGCRDIVMQFGLPWSDDYLIPLSASSVLKRMVNNMLNCLTHNGWIVGAQTGPMLRARALAVIYERREILDLDPTVVQLAIQQNECFDKSIVTKFLAS